MARATGPPRGRLEAPWARQLFKARSETKTVRRPALRQTPICSARSARRGASDRPWRFPMQLHLDEISSNVAKGAYAVVLLDRAGWHITSKLDMPENITPIFRPSPARELNPVENH